MRNNTISIILTLALIITGIYVGSKHYKDKGFWYGVLVLFLVTSSISVYTFRKK